MWSHTYTHRTTADPARLWDLLADVDGWGAWNDGIESIELQGPLAVGSRFVMTPPGDDPITSEVVELDPPRGVSDHTDLEGLGIRVDHRLTPVADGITEISYAVTVSGEVPDEVAEEVGRGVSADFPEVMAALAAAAERDR